MTIEYVDIISRAPLWRTIPANQRITEVWLWEKARRWWPDREELDSESAKQLARLNDPRCEIAVRVVGKKDDLWYPCVGQVVEGANRCKRHGGPSTRKQNRPTVAELVGRIAELETELERLKA